MVRKVYFLTILLCTSISSTLYAFDESDRRTTNGDWQLNRMCSCSSEEFSSRLEKTAILDGVTRGAYTSLALIGAHSLIKNSLDNELAVVLFLGGTVLAALTVKRSSRNVRLVIDPAFANRKKKKLTTEEEERRLRAGMIPLIHKNFITTTLGVLVFWYGYQRFAR